MAQTDTPVVQPIETVNDAGEVVTEAEKVVKEAKADFGQCWNCAAALSKDFVCAKCGFDRKLLYNLELNK